MLLIFWYRCHYLSTLTDSVSPIGGVLISLLPGPAKQLYLLNQLCDFKILQELECPKFEPHSLFYDSKRYIFPFGLSDAVNTVLKDLMN